MAKLNDFDLNISNNNDSTNGNISERGISAIISGVSAFTVLVQGCAIRTNNCSLRCPLSGGPSGSSGRKMENGIQSRC